MQTYKITRFDVAEGKVKLKSGGFNARQPAVKPVRKSRMAFNSISWHIK